MEKDFFVEKKTTWRTDEMHWRVFVGSSKPWFRPGLVPQGLLEVDLKPRLKPKLKPRLKPKLKPRLKPKLKPRLELGSSLLHFPFLLLPFNSESLRRTKKGFCASTSKNVL